MATTKDYRDFILEQLNLLDNITCKSMMGEYLLYYNGLFFGTLYAYSLIDSIEINTMQYIKGIHLDSYLQTFGFMILFTIIVSFGVHIALKKVDLIESLKSVE